VTAGEIAAVVASVVGTLLIIGFFVAFAGLLRTLRTLTAAVEELRAEVVPLAGQWRRTVDTANAELARVDGLITSAESVTATVDSASRLAYLALSNPVIKLMAFGSGTGRALRRVRRARTGSTRTGRG
jgi:hypothetical protein